MQSLEAERSHEADHLAHDLERALDAAPAARLSRSEIPREFLEAPTPAGLARMTVEEWALIGLLWVAVAASPGWFYPALAFLLAGRFHALGVILHDSAHMPLRRKSLGIRFVETFCGYPIATTLNAMRYHHLRHHRDSGMPEDPYFKRGRQDALWRMVNVLRGLALFPFWTVRALVGSIASIVPLLRSFYARTFLQDRSRHELRYSREVIDCARAEWGQLAFQGLVLALVLSRPSMLLWGYVVPVMLAGLLAARRLLIEHRYEEIADRRIETILRTTNDNHLGLAGSLGLAPRNIGYHVVHHIHPQVRLGALPRLREWYVQRHAAQYPSVRR